MALPTELRISPHAQAALDRYTETHYGDLSDINDLADVMFRAGGNQAVKAMEEFADITEKLDHLAARIHRMGEMVRSIVGKQP